MNNRHNVRNSIDGPAFSRPRRRDRLATLGLAVVVAGGLTTGSSGRAEQPYRLTERRPDRIVAIGGAVTEILYALGQQALREHYADACPDECIRKRCVDFAARLARRRRAEDSRWRAPG